MQPTLAITLYRRPKYTKILLGTLLQCIDIRSLPISISCDFNLQHDEACKEVISLARKFAASLPEGHVDVYVNNPRLGIDLNKLFVIPKALERGDLLLFLEDDTIPSGDALQWFMRTAESSPNSIICGYAKTNRSSLLPANRDAIECSTGFNPWGWAMPKAMWETLFANDGAQYKQDTGKLANGSFDKWIGAKQLPRISPVLARIQSIGGEDAEHTPSAEWHKENEYNEFGIWSL